jgi:hypothetical protein
MPLLRGSEYENRGKAYSSRTKTLLFCLICWTRALPCFPRLNDWIRSAAASCSLRSFSICNFSNFISSLASRSVCAKNLRGSSGRALISLP